MKQIKRYALILITIVLLASIPSTALAAIEYAPTKAIRSSYLKRGNDWVQNGSATTWLWSYKKDGRLTQTTNLFADGRGSWVKTTWKGDRVVKVSYHEGRATAYKYKKGMLTQITNSGKDYEHVTKYSIKKKKSVFEDGNNTVTISYTGKNQYKKVIAQYTNSTIVRTYQYYSNGNLKKYTATDNNYFKHVALFNKRGYLKSYVTKTPQGTSTTTYTYKYKKGKLSECTITHESDGSSSQQKFVYTKWKKVSRIRNTDGHECIWGIGVISEFDGRG